MRTSSTSSSKSIPTAFIIAALITLGIEVAQYQNEYMFYRPSKTAFLNSRDLAAGTLPLQLRFKNDTAYADTEGKDIVIVGDSTSLGVSPEILEASTGLTAFNYGTIGPDGPLSALMILRNALNRPQKKPSFVVFCWAPPYLLDSWNPRVGMEHAYAKGNGWLLFDEFGLGGFIKAQIPTIRHQVFLKEFIAKPSDFGSKSTEAAALEVEQLMQRKGQIQIRPDHVYRNGVSDQFLITPVMKEESEIDPKLSKRFEAAIGLAQDRGATVVIVRTPMAPKHYRQFAALPKWHVLEQYCLSISQRYPGVIWMDMQPEFMETDYFTDPIHLNGVGNKRLSEMIAARIHVAR